MEARSTAATAYLCCLAMTLGGCQWPNSGPAARPPETGTPAAEEHSEVVAGDVLDVQPAADVEPGPDPVQTWIERVSRIDDLHTRVISQPLEQALSPVIESGYSTESTQSAAPHEAVVEPQGTEPDEAQPPTPPAPVLGRVSVRAAELAEPPATPPTGTEPAVNAPVQATSSPLTLAEFAEQWLVTPATPSFRSQLDARLLLVLAGKYERAREPLELVSDDQQRMARQLVETLIAIRAGHSGDPGAGTSQALAQIRTLEESLVPLSDLCIPALALVRAVRGYGCYDAFDPPHFPTGRETEFVVYCEVDNFQSRLKDNGLYESQFSMRTAVLSHAGDLVLEINDEHIADECRTRRHDCFIPRLVRVPATLSPGEYVVKVTIADRIAGKVAEKRTTFRIVARP